MIGLVAVAAGAGMLRGFHSGDDRPRQTAWFFGSTAATLLTSFLFPFRGMTPAIAIGILCVVIYLPTWCAR